jgi:hypothetical protein
MDWKVPLLIGLALVLGYVMGNRSHSYQIIGNSEGTMIHRLDTQSGQIETLIWSRKEREFVPVKDATQ